MVVRYLEDPGQIWLCDVFTVVFSPTAYQRLRNGWQRRRRNAGRSLGIVRRHDMVQHPSSSLWWRLPRRSALLGPERPSSAERQDLNSVGTVF